MNIKNIMITTGMSFLFGAYSIYNIIDYLNNINRDNNHKLLVLQRKISETYDKYKILESNIKELREEIIILSHKIEKIEKIIEENPRFYFSVNDIYCETSEEDKKMEEEELTDEEKIVEDLIHDVNFDLNVPIQTITLEPINKSYTTPILVNNEDSIINCVEIVNIDDINNLQVSQCSSRKNSLEKDSNILRSRSSSLSDINWYGLTTKFMFG
jgi:hypothetical protein